MSAMVNITSAQHLPASTTALAPTSARLGLRSDEKWLIGILVPVGIFIITCIGAVVLRKCWKKYCSQTDFQRLPQTEQHVSGSGNTPINISTGPINIYQSQALNIQIFVLRNETIDGPLTDHLLKGLMTYVYDKAGHLFKTFGELLHVTSDSVVFVVRISSCASLEKLWTMYTSGELAKKLTEMFITDELTTEDKTDLSIGVTIQESDYVRACRFFEELERASCEGGAHTSLQPGQTSVDMSENQSSTSQQPTTQGTVSNPLTPECSTSDVQSQAAAAKCKDALKLHYRTTGSYVHLNPYEVDKKRIPDICTRLQLANAKGDLEGTLGSYEDILVLKTREGDLIKIAVLSGLAGTGKSTLFDKIAYDWAVDCSQALQKYELVFLLKMSYLEQASDLIDAVFDQLITVNIAKHIDKGALPSYIEKNADKVLILLDGFDELKTTSLSKSSFGSILKLLSRKSYKGCTVLVSTRPSHLHRLITKELVQEPFTLVMVLGFDRESIEEYVRRYYSDEPDKAKGLLERIGSFGNLSTLAESPMLLLLMCQLWREDSTLPKTISRLYQDAIEYIAKRKTVSEEEMSRVVVALGKVGLRGLLSPGQELTFKESDFEQSVLDIALKVGILTRQRVCKSLELHSIVRFIQKTFQEFSAAAYLQSLFQANTEEFHDTLNEIMSKDPLEFEYLLRFCCGDNEACTLEILKVFQERHQKDLSFDSKVGQLALHCYFEGQCKCLPPEEVMHSFLTDRIFIENLDNDSKNSVKYFVEQIKDSGNADFSELHTKTHSSYVPNIVEAFRGLPNLVALYLSGSDLGGTAALWGKQLGQCRALKELHLSDCKLNGQDMVHVAELLSGLPKLVRLDLSRNDLGGTAESWCKQLGKCKALQDLNLSGCKLNGQDMVHVAESLRGLPYLVALNLTMNDLGDTAESLCKQLGKCKALEDLKLSDCKLNGQDMVHVAESLTGLPNLVRLDLSFNIIGGTAALWCKQLGQCKALQDLNLSGCTLNGQDMVHVAESLRGLPNLVRLNLTVNILGGTTESWCKQLGQCKALQELNLCFCSLNGQGMEHVPEALRGLPNSVRLNISFGDPHSASVAFCAETKMLKAMEDLDLSGGKMTEEEKNAAH